SEFNSPDYTVPFVDATAPFSPPNVGRATFPAGYVAGTAPINAVQTYVQFATPGLYHTLYFRLFIKVSSNWEGHASGVNKVYYYWPGRPAGNGAPTTYRDFHGVGSGQMLPQLTLQGVPGQTNRQLTENVGPNKAFTRGVWHEVEILMTLNSAPGVG